MKSNDMDSYRHQEPFAFKNEVVSLSDYSDDIDSRIKRDDNLERGIKRANTTTFFVAVVLSILSAGSLFGVSIVAENSSKHRVSPPPPPNMSSEELRDRRLCKQSCEALEGRCISFSRRSELAGGNLQCTCAGLGFVHTFFPECSYCSWQRTDLRGTTSNLRQ